MSQVVISYSHDDKPYAETLADDLRKKGFDVWWDRELAAGERWSVKIFQAIRQSAALIVIMSPNANQSEWVEREIHVAGKADVPLFPLLLSGEVSDLMLIYQYEDVAGGKLPSDSFYERLRKVIAHKPAPEDELTALKGEFNRVNAYVAELEGMIDDFPGQLERAKEEAIREYFEEIEAERRFEEERLRRK